MTSMRYGGLRLAIFFGASICLPVQAQSDAKEKPLIVHHVGGSIHMLEGPGGNIGVSVGEDGMLMVDDKFTNSAPSIDAALAELGEGKPKFLLNTHHHFDHTGSNAHFGADAVIVAHENVRGWLSKAKNQKKEALPVVTFDESLSIHFNGERIRMIHFGPGHTNNDSVIFFTGSNVVHMGDLFFSGSFPSVYPAHGGDVVQYAANVGRALAQIDPDAKIIPGHGPLATVGDLKDFHDMLNGSLEIVEKRMKEGQNLKQIQVEGLPPEYDRWASPFTSTTRWLKIVYDGLERDAESIM